MINPRPLNDRANRSVIVTDGPDTLPVTLEEVKLFARIDGSLEDSLLNDLIADVTDAAEKYLGRALISRDLRMVMDWWPNKVELPCPPLQSVDSVVTIDEDGVETVFAASGYYVVVESIPGQLVIRQGIAPPVNTVRDVAGFAIDFTAGYGDAADIPKGIKTAILQWIAVSYEARLVSLEPPVEAKSKLDLYKVDRVIRR